MEFSLTTLGTASALPTAYRYPSAHVVTFRERLFLIDCGEGAQMQMRRAGVPFSKIDNIFLSHLHGDHFFGLFGLLSTFGMMGRLQPLYIYAPEGFRRSLDYFLSEFGDGIKYEIRFTPVKCKEPTTIIDGKKLEIIAFPLRHRMETYGYIFREKVPQLNIYKHLIEPYKLTLREIGSFKNGEDVFREDGTLLLNKDFAYLPYSPRQIAYCSDTAPFAKLPEYVKGSDLLYHEATFGSDLKDIASMTMHSTAEQAANTAVLSGSKKLIIGHFSSRYKSPVCLLEEARKIFKESYLAEEGTKFEVPFVPNN